MPKDFSNVKFPFDKIVWTDVTPTHFVGRCPFCNDSQSHKYKGHLYISKRIPAFICHRCSYHGSIKELEEFLNEKCKIIYDTSYSRQLTDVDIKGTMDVVKNDVMLPTNIVNQDEIDYFKKRCQLENEDNKELKKYFNLISNDLVKEKFPQTQHSLIDDRIWFVTSMGLTYIGRTINHHPIRYMKLNIENDDDFLTDCYVINNYDTVKTPSTLIIAEGIFDIIPIFLHHKKYGISKNAIYIACLGIFYSRAEKTFQNIFSCKPKIIRVFADKGVELDKLKGQFASKTPNQQIEINYPMVKDWEETGPIHLSIKL